MNNPQGIKHAIYHAAVLVFVLINIILYLTFFLVYQGFTAFFIRFGFKSNAKQTKVLSYIVDKQLCDIKNPMSFSNYHHIIKIS